jgi:hypothetical protein
MPSTNPAWGFNALPHTIKAYLPDDFSMNYPKFGKNEIGTAKVQLCSKM